jgi:hypothetical protein
MTWLHESQEITEIPEEYAGFVYLITNKQTGRMYVGKKLSKFNSILLLLNKLIQAPTKNGAENILKSFVVL